MRDYTARLIDLAEDFVNTYDTYLEQPERLVTPIDLRAFLEEHGIGAGDQIGEAELEAARAVRARLRAAWTTALDAERERLLHDLLSEGSVLPRVATSAEGAWHVTLVAAPGTPPIRQLALECALGIALALERFGPERLRACAAEPCRDVFVDTSRNRSRRYCSDRCANRHNIAAFRDRRRAG